MSGRRAFSWRGRLQTRETAVQISISQDTSHKLANLSFICACFVAYIHTCPATADFSPLWWFLTLGRSGIGSTAVPLFFVIAGFLLAGHYGEKGWWPRELWKRVWSLLVPYCLWKVLYAFSYGAVALGHIMTEASSQHMGAGQMLREMGSVIGESLMSGGPGHLWFIRALFLLVIAAPLLFWPLAKNRRFATGTMAVMLALYVIFCPGTRGEEPYSQIWWCFYFMLGAYLRNWPVALRMPKWSAVLLLLCCLPGYGFFWYGRTAGTNSLPVLYQFSLLGAMVALWVLVPRTKWPQWLTSCSFAIYLMHCLFSYRMALVGALFPAFEGTLMSIPGYLVYGALVVGSCVAVTHFLRRFLPRTARALFGGR